jgi:predicted ATPase
MITRIKINGFKNLREVDLRFSEFTCVAGPNGSGKSNLFDALQFLSLTGSKTILEAALAIRGDGGIASNPDHIFSFEGEKGNRRIDFEVEMIVAKSARDDLNQEARATFTFLTYELSIVERGNGASHTSLEIIKEQLSYHPWSEASKHLQFRHSTKWRASLKQATGGGGRRDFFISTADRGGETVIQRHQDGGSSGKPIPALARNLPRTVLSTANASESPTALCAKRELESWRFLALESSSLRAPDSFNDPSMIDVHGRHMPATLNRLIEAYGRDSAVASRIAARLTELVENVRDVQLDRDPVRQAYSIFVNDHAGNSIPARGLSDGTLRFLALAILEEDPKVTGVICLEEPENGIHPKRIPAIISLLRDIAMDPSEESGDDNPLRQIIINTHSPLVVAEVPDDSLVVVVDRTLRLEERLVQVPTFLGLPNTWRTKEDGLSVSRGLLLPYLNPIPRHTVRDAGKRRVADRDDLQALLPDFEAYFQ